MNRRTPAWALDLTQFSSADAATYAAWFADDETARRVSAPDAAWLAHVTEGRGLCWSARDAAGNLVAVLQCDPDDSEPRRGHICVTVDPARRGCGIGRAAIAAFAAGEGRRFDVLEGRIEPDNDASIAMSRAAGFRQISDDLDDDGMLRFALRLG